MGDTLKLGLQITANANQANSTISTFTKQVTGVEPVIKKAFDASVVNPFSAALSAVTTVLTNLDTTAKQASNTLQATGNILSLAGGNFETVGAAASKTAGYIDGFSYSIKIAIQLIQQITQPTSVLAQYTLNLGNSFSYTVGKFDAIIISAKLAYKAFDALPPKLKAVVVVLGTLNLASHAASGTLHLLAVTTQAVLIQVTNFSIGIARAGIGFVQLAHSIGSSDAILEKISIGLSKISQVLYSVGAFARIFGGQWAALGQVFLKSSGILSSVNVAFTQFSKTALGTGSSIKLLAGVMRLLTVQPQYVSGIMGGLSKAVTLAAESFARLSLSAKIAVVAVGAIGLASRTASASWSLMSGAVTRVSTALSFLKPAIAAVGSALLTLKALASTALPILAFFAIKSADSMSVLSARVGLATKSTEEFNYSIKRLNQLSVETGASIDGVVNIFTRANKPIKDMGGNFQSTAAFADTLSKSLTIGGATTSEVNSVLLQTSQMLAKTKFSGDEFMSLMENGPQVMDAMSKALGKTKGELIEMAGDQKLSSEMVVYALLKQQKEIQSAYDKLPMTVGRSVSQLVNVAKQYTTLLMDDTGKAAQAISDFAKNAAAALASGQFAQELKAIGEDFALLAKDIQHTAALFSGDAVFGSFDNFFVKLRTTVRIFVIDSLAEFDKFKVGLNDFFSLQSAGSMRQGVSEKSLKIAAIEKNRDEMNTLAAKEALDAINKTNAAREKGTELLKEYTNQQGKSRAEEEKKVAETIATLEPKVQKALAEADKKQSDKISTATSKLDEALARAAKKYGFDFEAVNAKFAEVAAKQGIDEQLLKAQSFVESAGFNPRAKSSAGAVGFSQFMPATAERFGLKDRTDPIASIEAQGKYMRFLLDKFGNNPSIALAGYNAGEGNVEKYGGNIPPFKETQGYVKKVLALVDGDLKTQFESQQKLQENQLDAQFSEAKSAIDLITKQAEFESKTAIEGLKRLKEQGTLSIDEYYAALTTEQEKAANASIAAIKARLALAAKEFEAAKLSAAPEELPKIEAQFKIDQASMTQELEHLQVELANIKPINLIDANKELEELDKVAKAAAEARQGRINDAFQGTSLAQPQQDPQLEKITTARQKGDITFDEFTRATEEVKLRTDTTFQGLVELGKGAANELQKSFADFLFDPFNANLKAMALSFLTTVRRMVADALAQMAVKAVMTGVMNLVGGGMGSAAGAMGGGGGGSVAGLFHDGGVVGQSARTITVNPLAFASAVRYHTGGIAGLQSNEVPAVLQKGEEVLTRNDPRHRNNGGGSASNNSGGNFTSIVVMDPNFVPDAMSGQSGSKIVIQIIRDNADAIRQIIG